MPDGVRRVPRNADGGARVTGAAGRTPTAAPGVPQDHVTEPWWDATRERRLLLQHCAACDRVQHPPRPVCTACGAEPGWSDAAGTGGVDAWTVVRRSPGPGLDPPYVVARVRLTEGPVLLTNLPGTGPYRCGQPVALDWRALPDGRHLPVFVPED